MSLGKAVQIGKDIDTARCNGNWAALPELARRYKKHNANGAILEQTILAEAALAQELSTLRSKSNVNYTLDSPYHISMEKRLDSEQLVSIQAQLNSAIQSPDTIEQNAIQKEFARIILARTHFECGEYEKAIDIIGQLSFGKDHVSKGYGLVLFLQARAIKAISLELTGNDSQAFLSYQGVEALLAESDIVKSKSLIEWSEEALYRATLLYLKEGSPVTPSTMLEFMRQYQKVTATQSPGWRLQKRMKITRQSLKYVSSIYRQGDYCLPIGTILPTDDNSYSQSDLERQIFIVEQSQLHTLYEKMLYLEVPLPRAGQVNTHVLDFIDQFASDFELIGTSAYDLRGFVQVLDRASQRTFNSPLITRHLFRALVRLGEYDEAEHALQAYLYLVGLVSYGWKESRRDGQALATNKAGFNLPVPVVQSDIESKQDVDDAIVDSTDHVDKVAESIADIKGTESEKVADILDMLVLAIEMYAQALSRGVEAVETAEIAKELLIKQSRREQTTTLLQVSVRVYRAMGVAYGLLACQTFDPELRPRYHERALVCLEKALQLDTDSWETYYQLALQQAEMRVIGKAVQFATKSLQINSGNLAGWHLLTLLLSCPVQGDCKQALKMCEMGLSQATALELEDDHDLAEQHIICQMTRVLLMNALHGPEASLESSESLFSSFGRIAIPEISISTNSQERMVYGGVHHGMIVSGSLGNLSDLQNAAEQRRRGRSASSSVVNNEVSTGSRSQENMLTVSDGSGSNKVASGRARSASNLALNNPSPLGPNAQKEDGAEQNHHHHHFHPHIHGLHLFGKGSSQKSKQVGDTLGNNISIQSLPSTPASSPYGELKGKAGMSVTSFASFSPSSASMPSILQPTSIPTKPSVRTLLRKQRSDRILSDLWILTAQMFIRLEKLDEARKAVEEAENIDWVNNPQVWCMLGQLLLTECDTDQAQAAFHKSLVIDPYNVKGRVQLAKSYLGNGDAELAEGILEVLTKSNGWDCAEAWFLLGEIYKNTDRLDRTKACLFHALELESTSPIQPFSVLPRFIR